MTRKRWRIHPQDQQLVQSLETTVSPIVAQLLARRGIQRADVAAKFLDVRLSDLRDPETLPGVPQAADLIYRAIQAKQKIVIYGDYDADGMTSTAILFRCLKALDGNVDYFVPNRLDDGYGLNNDALTKLADRGAQMIVTVDCGVASVDEVRHARQLGLQVVVTDHHEMADELPDADAIVHPRLPGADYPFDGLCGAGVALKLAWAICKRASEADKVEERLRNFLMMALGLAAIGTVADVVPLVDENRVIVRHGLASLVHFGCEGIRQLLEITKLNERPKLAAEDLAFTLGPRLNAAGRLGQAQLGVELLTCDDKPRVKSLVEYIDQLNKSRDSIDRSILLAANKQIKEEYDAEGDSAFVLAHRDWHLGVIGIVAGRLAERYHRPAIMISMDPMHQKPAVGSARSTPNLDLYEILGECREHLISYGGHRAAAGFKIAEESIEAFRNDFLECVASRSTTEQMVPEIEIDIEVTLSQLTLNTVQDMETLAPFGQGNPRPTMCASAVTLFEPPKPLGSGQRHLQMRIEQHGTRMRVVGFGKADQLKDLEELNGPMDIAFRPVINDFRGRRNVELHLIDWRPANLGVVPSPHSSTANV